MFNRSCLIAFVGFSIYGSTAFALSAANWKYDGEFQTTNTFGQASNTPAFVDINEFGELAYGHFDFNNNHNELYVVSGIFSAAAGGTTIPVTQTKLPSALSFEANRGFSGVAYQPGTGNLY